MNLSETAMQWVGTQQGKRRCHATSEIDASERACASHLAPPPLGLPCLLCGFPQGSSESLVSTCSATWFRIKHFRAPASRSSKATSIQQHVVFSAFSFSGIRVGECFKLALRAGCRCLGVCFGRPHEGHVFARSHGHLLKMPEAYFASNCSHYDFVLGTPSFDISRMCSRSAQLSRLWRLTASQAWFSCRQGDLSRCATVSPARTLPSPPWSGRTIPSLSRTASDAFISTPPHSRAWLAALCWRCSRRALPCGSGAPRRSVACPRAGWRWSTLLQPRQLRPFSEPRACRGRRSQGGMAGGGAWSSG